MPNVPGDILQKTIEVTMDVPLLDELRAYGNRQTPQLTLKQVIVKFSAEGVGYRRERYLSEYAGDVLHAEGDSSK